MSDYIPFEIQSDIIKSLPVKSLVQFRSVSKQWKAFIDNPEFINNYHVNHTNPQHHLLLQYELDDTVKRYTSIGDNNTFPQQKFPLTTPESLRLLRNTITLGSINGLLCFSGFYGDVYVAVIWNPTIRKSVRIVFPGVVYMRTILGFGVCHSDPKLVKINVDNISGMWVVDVFTLSTCVWKTVYTGVPFKSCDLACGLQVCVDGVTYFRAYDVSLNRRSRLNSVVSFDLKSEKFGDVCLPEKLLHTPDHLHVAKVNESLGLLEYCDEGDMRVCGVWTRKDGDNKMFSKIYTVKVVGKSLIRVLEFRNSGGVVIELMDDNYMQSGIEVYEPLSGHTIGVGINGKKHTIFALSYTETLLLLDQSDSITN